LANALLWNVSLVAYPVVTAQVLVGLIPLRAIDFIMQLFQWSKLTPLTRFRNLLFYSLKSVFLTRELLIALLSPAVI
jgi:hypothetical protein